MIYSQKCVKERSIDSIGVTSREGVKLSKGHMIPLNGIRFDHDPVVCCAHWINKSPKRTLFGQIKTGQLINSFWLERTAGSRDLASFCEVPIFNYGTGLSFAEEVLPVNIGAFFMEDFQFLQELRSMTKENSTKAIDSLYYYLDLLIDANQYYRIEYIGYLFIEMDFSLKMAITFLTAIHKRKNKLPNIQSTLLEYSKKAADEKGLSEIQRNAVLHGF